MDVCCEPSDPRNTAPGWMRQGIFYERATAKKYDEQNAFDILAMYRHGVPQSDIARMLGCSINRVHRVVAA
mgnify:CR=1 FL=1